MSRLMLRVVFAALLLPMLGAAQTSQQAPAAAPAAIAPAKLAFVNLEQVIFTSDEGKRQLEGIQKFVDSKNSELEAAKKELDGLKNTLEVQRGKLTDDARADMEAQVETKETALERFRQDTQKEIDNRRTRIYNSIGRKMQAIIEKVAKEKGLSAVFYVTPSRDAWIDPNLVISEDIVKAYNQANPAGATTPAPAKKP